MDRFGRPRQTVHLRAIPHSRQLLVATAMLCMGIGIESPAAAGVLGYWRFEQDFSDSSGNGHHATGVGPQSFSSDHSSAADGAYSLVNPLFAAVDVTGFTGPANDFTIELFFQTSAAGSAQFLVTTLDHGFGAGGWVLGLTAAGEIFFSTETLNPNPFSLIQTSGSSFADGDWHHVAATLSSTDFVQIYVDGALEASGQGQLPSSSRLHLRFGKEHSVAGANGFDFPGSLDEIRLSSGVLTPDEFARVSPVPEPASLTLFGLGAIGLALHRSRQTRGRAA